MYCFRHLFHFICMFQEWYQSAAGSLGMLWNGRRQTSALNSTRLQRSVDRVATAGLATHSQALLTHTAHYSTTLKDKSCRKLRAMLTSAFQKKNYNSTPKLLPKLYSLVIKPCHSQCHTSSFSHNFKFHLSLRGHFVLIV